MTKIEIGSISGVVIVDNPVPVNESIQSNGILLDIFINFVEAGGIVDELELVGTDGGSGRSEGSESGRFHL